MSTEIPENLRGTFTVYASGSKKPDETPVVGTKIVIDSSSVKVNGVECTATSYNKDHDAIYCTDKNSGNYQISRHSHPSTVGKRWIFGSRRVNDAKKLECPGAAGVFGAEDDNG